MSAVTDWGTALAAWAVPEAILAAAPESPYGFPAELFRKRADVALASAPTPSAERALEALPERGTVLDVGVGGGAASLPLAGRASLIVGVDSSEAMLDSFREAGSRVGAEVRAELGEWPDVAASLEPADVVVCNHVLYNAQELESFVRALADHARRRVVVEITERHPIAWMNELWLRFHELERPARPTADDAVAALAELGVAVHRDDWMRESAPTGFERRGDAIALVRRRLCLPAERDAEVAEALGDGLAERDGLWSAGPADQPLVTMWWDPRP